jgi:hypothetical protein
LFEDMFSELVVSFDRARVCVRVGEREGGNCESREGGN